MKIIYWLILKCSQIKKEEDIKALLISAWAAKSKETLRVDLWTKDMPVHEMYILFHQTMLGMASTLEKINRS